MLGLSSMTSTASESFLMNVRDEAHCILAEIVRLAGFVTQDFVDPSSSKYKTLLLDFNYFTRTNHYEKIIEENEELQDSFYSANGDLITRFSALFQALANFLCSLKEYCDQVGNERVGISYLDIMDVDILYHIGMVLMYLDNFLPGPIRERIYVAIYRNSDERRNVEFLVDFLKMHPTNSEPCYLFDRLKLSESLVEKCLSCCETIHREGTNDFGKLYVDRSTLIKWIFICLAFKPSTLKNDAMKMRQIVEDFFRDEWVIQLGLGLNVNLLDYWQSYRAALTAITNHVDLNKAKSMASYHYNALSKLSIPQGKISPNDFDAHIRLISQYNTSLRWLILHTSKLHDWFMLMKKTLEELVLENEKNGEFVIQVKRRIVRVDEMHDLSGNLAVAQHIQKLITQLDCLAALYNVREEDERQAQRYADPSYLWPILDDWIPRIQRRILESSNVNVVRALFFKLAISISTLCERFGNQERKNLIGRAYSYHLERRLRAILQTIPNKLFSILKSTLCPALQRQWEPTLDKNVAREMADFDDNFRLAEATYTISNLSLGVSRMALKKVGMISINPKELLEEGIRRELASELPSLLTLLDKNTSLEDVLKILSLNLHPFHRGFIYMCEHVDINGHDMWREEVDAVLRRTAKDLMDRGSTQPQTGGNTANAVPALTLVFNLMVKHSDPFSSHYVEGSMTWRDVKTKKDVLSSKMIDLVEVRFGYIAKCVL
ncbi:hypothetical protein GCK32_008829 [Trichostrongylus colubriformis]|uniref:Uncharacterized protein n=1 Tax=Trichostrongylus colubriformis TaxID=6319 RepID=A0AAN8FMK3_TRICO